MKKLVVLFVVINLAGCNKGISPESELIGNWMWISTSGGFDGRIVTPGTNGDEISIEITKTRFKTYINGTLSEDIEYSIQLGPSIYSSEDVSIITFENGLRQSYSVTKSSLILKDECYDCFRREFLKIISVQQVYN